MKEGHRYAVRSIDQGTRTVWVEDITPRRFNWPLVLVFLLGAAFWIWVGFQVCQHFTAPETTIPKEMMR